MEKEWNDKDIVELVNKNRNNFYLIVDQYKDALERYIKRISFFSESEVEDILQDIFIKVYKNINTFDPSLKFSSWIYRIAHNETVDKIRKNSKRISDVSIDNEDLNLIIKSDENIEKNLINKENIEKIKKAFNELPNSYKEVMILRFIEEKSYEEIMDILKKPKGTVAALINKGRSIIKQKLIL